MLKLMPCLFGDKLWGSSMGTGAVNLDTLLVPWSCSVGVPPVTSDCCADRVDVPALQGCL